MKLPVNKSDGATNLGQYLRRFATHIYDKYYQLKFTTNRILIWEN